MLVTCPQCHSDVHTHGGFILRHMCERRGFRDICDASETPYVVGCECTD